MNDLYLVVGINPEPWAIGNLNVIRRGNKAIPIIGPNLKLKAYQEALREELPRQCPDFHTYEGELEIEFHFWRSSAYGNVADATNLQKATEDALQGLLFANDRSVRWIASHVAEQTPTTPSAVAIYIGPYQPYDVTSLRERIDNTVTTEAYEGADWSPPKDDLF